MSLVDKGVAIEEFNKWLDFKKIGDKKREERKEQIEALVSEIEDGTLAVDENCNLIYTLKFPIEDENGSAALIELKFKPRMRVNDLDPYLKGVKPSDADGRVRAHISALTGKASSMISKLDTEDSSVCQNIAIFFL